MRQGHRCIIHVHALEYIEAESSHLPILADHDIVRVAITNAQYISGHTVASTGESEVLNGLVQLAGIGILLSKPLQQQFLVKSSPGTTTLLLDLSNGGGVQDDFNQTYLIPCGQTAIGNHPGRGRGKGGMT